MTTANVHKEIAAIRKALQHLEDRLKPVEESKPKRRKDPFLQHLEECALTGMRRKPAELKRKPIKSPR